MGSNLGSRRLWRPGIGKIFSFFMLVQGYIQGVKRPNAAQVGNQGGYQGVITDF